MRRPIWKQPLVWFSALAWTLVGVGASKAMGLWAIPFAFGLAVLIAVQNTETDSKIMAMGHAVLEMLGKEKR